MGLFTRKAEPSETPDSDAAPAAAAPERLPVKTRVLAQLAKVARWAHVLPARADDDTADGAPATAGEGTAAPTPSHGATRSPKARAKASAKKTAVAEKAAAPRTRKPRAAITANPKKAAAVKHAKHAKKKSAARG